MKNSVILSIVVLSIVGIVIFGLTITSVSENSKLAAEPSSMPTEKRITVSEKPTPTPKKESTFRWYTDMEEAKKVAEKEDKDLFLDFTGSDWCQYCMALESQVFSKPEFKKEGPINFVLVKIDFPKYKELPEGEREKNERLAMKYEVEGYPTIILADAKGRAYGKTGYSGGGADYFVNHIQQFVLVKEKRDEILAKAKKAEGVEKAKLLDQAIEFIEDQQVLYGYEDLMGQIILADANNEAGLKQEYDIRKSIDKARQFAIEDKVDKSMKELDSVLQKYNETGPQKQDVYVMKALIFQYQKDTNKMISALKTAHEADPDSEWGKQIKKFLDKQQQTN